jgi:hypothetical protein
VLPFGDNLSPLGHGSTFKTSQPAKAV